MTNYNGELLALQQKVALKKQLEAKLNDLRDQRRVFDQKAVALRVTHRDEQADVEKLEGRSLANYFYRVIGKMDGKLDEERRQAAAAKVKLDAAERELAAIGCEIQELQVQLSKLWGCEKEYSDALAKKSACVKASGAPAGAEILMLEEKIASLENRKKEIREASSAGFHALGTAGRVLDELADAASWNTWDMIGGGGIITHMAKHGHLDEAQDLIEELQGKLRKFKTELADIHIHAYMQVSIDGFLRFADYFFDGLFADWAVGDRISESKSSVEDVEHQIRSALNKLDTMEAATDQEIKRSEVKLQELLMQV